MTRLVPKTPLPIDQSTSRPAPVHDGLPNPQRMLAFATLVMATAMAVLDGAIVNVALPTIAHELAIPNADSVWIVNAFQLAVTVSLLPLSALGDGLGSSRLSAWPRPLHAGVACLRVRPDPYPADACAGPPGTRRGRDHERQHRLVRFIYPSSRLGRGVGAIALVVAVCSAGSPTVAAAILSVASWRWLFLINVPVGLEA